MNRADCEVHISHRGGTLFLACGGFLGVASEHTTVHFPVFMKEEFERAKN
jgi:hypothetical protein